MTGFDTCNTLRRGVFPYITSTLIGRGCLTTIIYDSAEGTLRLIQRSLLYPIGVLGVEPKPRANLAQRTYKIPLTTKSHEHKS